MTEEPGTSRTSSMVPRAVEDRVLASLDDLQPERARAFVEDYQRLRRYGGYGVVVAGIALVGSIVLLRHATWLGGFAGATGSLLAVVARRSSIRLALRANHIDTSLRPEIERRLGLKTDWTRRVGDPVPPRPGTVDEMVNALCGAADKGT